MPVDAMGHAPDEAVFVRLLRKPWEPAAELDAGDVRIQEGPHGAIVIVAGVGLGIPGVVVGHPAP